VGCLCFGSILCKKNYWQDELLYIHSSWSLQSVIDIIDYLQGVFSTVLCDSIDLRSNRISSHPRYTGESGKISGYSNLVAKQFRSCYRKDTTILEFTDTDISESNSLLALLHPQ